MIGFSVQGSRFSVLERRDTAERHDAPNERGTRNEPCTLNVEP